MSTRFFETPASFLEIRTRFRNKLIGQQQRNGGWGGRPFEQAQRGPILRAFQCHLAGLSLLFRCVKWLSRPRAPPIPPSQDLRKDSSPRMPLQGPLRTRTIPTGGGDFMSPIPQGLLWKGVCSLVCSAYPPCGGRGDAPRWNSPLACNN